MSYSPHRAGPAHPPGQGPGYETADLSMKGIVRFGIGFAVFIVIAHLIMIAMFFVLKQEKPGPITPLSPPRVQVRPPIIGPQLEVDPSYNWEEMKKAQNQLLHGDSAYGWVDPEKGTVRIPIDRAMELAVDRGFPVRAAATQHASSK